jgi:hypothetical protein
VFGSSVRLEVVQCTADVAYSAVEVAGHLDRIPLGRHGSDDRESRPGLLVLLPALPADLPAVRTDRYPWLVFARLPRFGLVRDRTLQDVRDGPVAEPGNGPVEAERLVQTDPPVQVHVADAPRIRAEYRRATGALVHEAALAQVHFPRFDWRPLPDPATVETIRAAVERGGAYTDVDVVVTTAETSREALATARARALVAELGLGAGPTDRPVGIYSAQVDGPDAVVFMVRRKR